MLTYPSDREIAITLADQMPEHASLLLQWFSEAFPEDARATKHSDDPSFVAGILVALLTRTKSKRPLLRKSEVLSILTATNGTLLLPVRLEDLPAVLGDEVSEGMIQEPDAEPLRREIESGMEPDLWPETNQLPPFRLKQKIAALEPLGALSVAVSAAMWFAQRDLLPQDVIAADDSDPLRLQYFFNIVQSG